MAHIIRKDAEGCTAPYDVFYYDVRGDDLIRQAGFDPNSVRPLSALPLDAGEVARVISKSTPGGAWVCGSRKAEQALLRWLESQP
jgi:hypothetical protein